MDTRVKNNESYFVGKGKVLVQRQSLCKQRVNGRRPICNVVREFFHSEERGKRASYTTGVKARIASGPRVALRVDNSVIRYWGTVAIARVAMFYGMRVRSITELQRAKKFSTADVERREGHPSKGGLRAVPPTLP